MITSTAAAELSIKSYGSTPQEFYGVYRNPWVTICSIMIDGTLVIVIPGSEKLIDFIDDLKSTFEYRNHPILGLIVTPFYNGIDDAFIEIKRLSANAQKVAFVGHSLGCAMAQYLAGLFIHGVGQVESLDCFEPPRSSGEYLDEYLTLNIARYRKFQNGCSPITHLPILPYLFTGSLIHVDGSPPTPWQLDPIRYHMIDNVLKGVAAWELSQ
jgi:hypothetical protein